MAIVRMVNDAIATPVEVKLDESGAFNGITKGMAGHFEFDPPNHGASHDRRRPELELQRSIST